MYNHSMEYALPLGDDWQEQFIQQVEQGSIERVLM